MVDLKTREQYKATIGIETHVQLKTQTKLFAAVSNDAREAPPNSLVSHICFGLPGSLPVLNEQAITLATRAAFALSTRPQLHSEFDRKHYFYPDLPKGYQITQYEHPIIVGGYINILSSGHPKRINITRAHLEEDAGKSTHPEGKDYSLVDLNRAGTPLLEIVSEPEMHTAEDAKSYARELWLLMRYADVSDANLYYGNMRFDVNVSVSKDQNRLGIRSETKNLNSFRSVEKAVEYEIERQIELLEKGRPIIQETRGWNDAKQKTFSQRTKENAHDYRYFPEPDIPPVELDDSSVDIVKNTMPTMPGEWRNRLSALGLDTSHIETLLDVQVELNTHFLSLIETHLDDKEKAKMFANWIVNIEVPLRRELIATAEDIVIKDNIRDESFSGVYQLVKSGKLNSSRSKALLIELLSSSTVPESFEKYAEDNGYIQVSDEGEIIEIIKQVVIAQPKAAEDVRQGELKAIGFLVGQVMKLSGGKANPQLTQELIKKQLKS